MAKKIIIIGAGIAGLSAACYARMNGYEAEIYEMQDKPGGLCTSWKRKDYTIDGCIHWLIGSNPNSSFYKLWSELGAIQGRQMLYHDVFYRYTGSNGKTLVIYCDVDKLEAHMKEISPADSATIELLCRMIRRFTKFPMPIEKSYELYNFLDIARLIIKMIPFYRDMHFCNQITIGEFAQRFKDPFLREVFPLLLWEKDQPLLNLVVTLAELHAKDGGFPQGGSLEFSRSIERRCLNLGAKIFYRSRVSKILEENGRAVGIQLADGKEIRGDYIISAADLRTTLYEMLDGKHIHPIHQELFQSCKLIPSMVQVSFGVNMDLSSQPECLGECYKTPFLKKWKADWIVVKNYCFDPTLAPVGKSVVITGFSSDDYQYWEKLANDNDTYEAEKKKIASAFADELERKYPGFRSAIEVTDVVTPITYARYTGNWKGTFMTWVITPDKLNRFRVIPKTVPNLENFWLSGMWVQPPGGVPAGAMISRHIIQIICKKDNKRFQTSTPVVG
ncbi:MAG: NAD(P)/FAD-dependent oxidoreductase [Candidatus Methanofastidiosa archaeon]|nr:NAD(P)/FAD-dependent oxidoreductase [Candidatus Methanofastidiosa archaeon]